MAKDLQPERKKLTALPATGGNQCRCCLNRDVTEVPETAQAINHYSNHDDDVWADWIDIGGEG